MSGKKRAKSAGTDDWREAERLAGEMQKELSAGRYAAPSKITWQDFRDRYRDEKLAGTPHSTQVAYTVAPDHLGRVVGPDRLAKLTSQVVSGFVAKLRGEGMKPTTIARHLRHIKAALRWAGRQGMLATVPTFEMPRMPKGQQMKGRPIAGEEFDRLIAAVPQVRPQDAPAWVRLLTVLASALGLPARTVSEVTEPFLIRAGLVVKDDQSRRELTAAGYEQASKSRATSVKPPSQ